MSSLPKHNPDSCAITLATQPITHLTCMYTPNDYINVSANSTTRNNNNGVVYSRCSSPWLGSVFRVDTLPRCEAGLENPPHRPLGCTCFSRAFSLGPVQMLGEKFHQPVHKLQTTAN